MKRFIIVISFFSFVSISNATEFLGLPIPGGANILQRDEGRLEFETDMNHNQCVDYYRQFLSKARDIKIREWKEATYIEDDGKLPWHSITISRDNYKRTRVIIIKDNWTWIMGTLILRYIGVFVVLIVLYIFMSIAGTIASRLFKDKK